ncbi:hypothetical protein, partial [Ketobacter sp.]
MLIPLHDPRYNGSPLGAGRLSNPTQRWKSAVGWSSILGVFDGLRAQNNINLHCNLRLGSLMGNPLSGLLVVSLEQAVAAPYVSSRLADA